MSSALAFQQLDDAIKRVRSLGALPEQIAPAVAKAYDSELAQQIARGEDPYGNRWARTQKGDQPLRNAKKNLTVRASGSIVIARLVGPEVLHHLGKAAGRITRRILPNKRVPKNLIAAVSKAAHAGFQKCLTVKS